MPPALRIYAICVLLTLAAFSYFFLWDDQRSHIQDTITRHTPTPTHTKDATFREKLAKIGSLDNRPHSRTLGVASRLYTIGLAHRKDRHDSMERLASAMEIDLTWHYGLLSSDPLVDRILERVQWARAESLNTVSHTHSNDNPTLHFSWAPDVGQSGPLDSPEESELWFLPPGTPGALNPLPQTSSADSPISIATLNGEDFVYAELPVLRAQISCWYSHYEVLSKIARGDDEVAIVFEDDIDMEWDLEARLRRLWEYLPEDWDIVMLGHCMSKEWEKPAVHGTPYLHPSTHVLCTHAYAVSREGARRAVRYLRSSLFAFSRPIDGAINHLNFHKLLTLYSVEPPVVVQTRTTLSDIFDGFGSAKDQWLDDSAVDRLAMYDRLAEEQKSI